MMPIRRINRSLSRVALIWRSSNLKKDPRSLSYRYASWSRPTVKNSQRTSLCLKYLSVGSDEGEDERSWRDIDTAEFVQIVHESSKKETNILIVDVREPEELVESGLIPGSVNIPRTFYIDDTLLLKFKLSFCISWWCWRSFECRIRRLWRDIFYTQTFFRHWCSLLLQSWRA